MSKRYNLEDLPTAPTEQDTSISSGPIGDAVTIDDINRIQVSAKIKKTITDGHVHDFDEVFPSPSEARMAVMAALIDAGHPDEQILGILLDDRYKIGVRGNGKRITEQDARKDIARARGKVKSKQQPTAEVEFEGSEIDPKWLPKMFTPFVLPDKPPPPRDWIYRPVYIRKNVTLTTARGGTGKSTLVMAENVAMATCLPLLGVDPLPGLRVGYWNGEDSPEELERRLYAICKYYKISKARIGDRLFVDTGLTLPIKLATTGPNGEIKIAAISGDIQYALKFLKMDHLSIDPFVASHSVSENDTLAMETVAKEWAHIAHRGNNSIGLVHHSRKSMSSGTSVGQIEDSRGSSALIDAARVRRAVNGMTESEAKAAGFTELEKRKFYISADLSRSNLSPPAAALDWYHMHSVDLDNATATQPSDKVGVPEPYEYVNLGDVEFTPDEQRKALAAIRKGTGLRTDVRAKQWVGFTVLAALDIPKTDKQARVRVQKLIAEWLRAGKLSTYEGADNSRRPVECVKCVD